jgi:hypothetical protein
MHQGCEIYENLKSSAIFLPMIYGMTSPMTIPMIFWRLGLMTIAILIPMILLSRKLYPSGE